MKKYAVIIEDSAQADIQRSYNWGRRVWGREQAQKWGRDLRHAILKQLTVIPTGFRLAAENDKFEEDIRQLVLGRYRVLFTIQGRTIHVLHVRGAYIGVKLDAADD